jgi:DMSO/TMAO reductase YedYZ molybdopterin-dependent catalytic subunit
MRNRAVIVGQPPATQDGGVHQRAPEKTDSEQATGPSPNAIWWARLAGLVSGLAGLAIAELVAWAVAPDGSPVPAVGELIIGLLPAPLINWGKETLGTADKPVLIAIITVAVLALAGLAGQLERRRRYAGAVVFAVIAVLGIIGVAARPGTAPSAYVPTFVGLLIGYMILGTLIAKLWRWLPRRAAIEPDAPPSAARRNFLAWTILVGAAAGVAAVAGSVLSKAATAVTDARAKLRLPAAAKAAAPVPTGAELGVPGITPYVTPNEEFYRIDTSLQVPVIDPDGWRLTITGMVENEVAITYAELLAKPLVEHFTTLTCVSNEVGGDLAGNARWLGYPIRELLAQAKPLAGADMVLSTSDDGWTAGTPLTALTDPDREAILAIGMNGEPLPIEHGFPVRMVVPGLYGYVSATKWVVNLKLTTYEKDQAYWTPLGWSAKGPIKIASRIDVPTRPVDAGTVAVAGVAWAQHTGISRVEVQVDQGPWLQAEIADTTGPDTWRQWKYPWAATSGTHRIAVRATDANGTLQTAALAPPAPDGATGYHSISVKVR